MSVNRDNKIVLKKICKGERTTFQAECKAAEWALNKLSELENDRKLLMHIRDVMRHLGKSKDRDCTLGAAVRKILVDAGKD